MGCVVGVAVAGAVVGRVGWKYTSQRVADSSPHLAASPAGMTDRSGVVGDCATVEHHSSVPDLASSTHKKPAPWLGTTTLLNRPVAIGIGPEGNCMDIGSGLFRGGTRTIASCRWSVTSQTGSASTGSGSWSLGSSGSPGDSLYCDAHGGGEWSCRGIRSRPGCTPQPRQNNNTAALVASMPTPRIRIAVALRFIVLFPGRDPYMLLGRSQQ